MGETRSRSFLKAVSWRVIATLTGTGLVLLFTDDTGFAEKFLVADILLKLLFYYMHERGWAMVTWGKVVGSSPEPRRQSVSTGAPSAPRGVWAQRARSP